MDVKQLSWHELVALTGGALLALGLFLPWYHAENRRADIAGTTGPKDLTAWDVHAVQRWLWIAAAAAPFILAYIVLRGHALSWPRGEMTAVVAIAAFGLVLYPGVIDRPGEPNSLIALRYGWMVSMLGVILMLVGAALRASSTERPRKPPGVL